MRIYLAAPYAMRNLLRDYADDLQSKGHECTSTWLEATHEINAGTLGTSPDSDDDYCRTHVRQDLDDVCRSDALILLSWPYCEGAARVFGLELGGNSGGRHVETGAALALGIDVIVIGDAENIFHRGACTVVDCWDAALDELESLHNKRFGITG